MPAAVSKIGFKVTGFAPDHDIAWHWAGKPGRRKFWRQVEAIVKPIYDAQLAAGIGRDGSPLKPISQHTREHRKSAMGKADPNAPPLTPAHALSRTRSYLRSKVLDDGVWFYWRFDYRVKSTWGLILTYQAAAGRDVFGLSPASYAAVRKAALAWWKANREQLGKRHAHTAIGASQNLAYNPELPPGRVLPSAFLQPGMGTYHGTVATSHLTGARGSNQGKVTAHDFGPAGLQFGKFGSHLSPKSPPKPPPFTSPPKLAPPRVPKPEGRPEPPPMPVSSAAPQTSPPKLAPTRRAKPEGRPAPPPMPESTPGPPPPPKPKPKKPSKPKKPKAAPPPPPPPEPPPPPPPPPEPKAPPKPKKPPKPKPAPEAPTAPPAAPPKPKAAAKPKKPKAAPAAREAAPPPIAEPIAPPAPTPAPTAEKPWPTSPLELKVIQKLGGSTGAELVEDPATGERFVRKRGSSANHLREEAHADAAYRALGVRVPDSKLFETAEGPVKLSRFIEGRTLGGLKTANPDAYKEAVKEIRKGFTADALLGNWDVIGSDADNILVTPDGKVYRIDNGGSLRYRAMGSKKSASQWSADVGELHSLRDSSINRAAAGVFGDVTTEEIKHQAAELLTRRAELLAAVPAELHATLGARLDSLRNWLDIQNRPKPAARMFTELGVTVSDLAKKEMNQYGRDGWQSWANGLSQPEQDGIRSYKGNGYTSINDNLRKGSAPSSKIKAIDKALERGKLPEQVVVYRGVRSRDDVGLGHDLLNNVGRAIPELGYMSTSLNWETSLGGFAYHSGALMRITVPAGTHGAWIDSLGIREYEILVGRGYQVEIHAYLGLTRGVPTYDAVLTKIPSSKSKTP